MVGITIIYRWRHIAPEEKWKNGSSSKHFSVGQWYAKRVFVFRSWQINGWGDDNIELWNVECVDIGFKIQKQLKATPDCKYHFIITFITSYEENMNVWIDILLDRSEGHPGMDYSWKYYLCNVIRNRWVGEDRERVRGRLVEVNVVYLLCGNTRAPTDIFLDIWNYVLTFIGMFILWGQ